MARPRLHEQVTELLDRDPSARLDVLVRVGDPSPEPLASVAARTLREWSRCHSCRQILPAAPRTASVAHALAAAGLPVTTAEAQRRESLALLTALLAGHPDWPAPAQPLWAARSVRVTLGRDAVAALRDAEPPVAAVEPNRRIPVPPVLEVAAEPAEEQQEVTWGLQTVGAPRVWQEYGVRGDGVLIGLLDTGVDGDHPELAGKVAAWAEFDAAGRQLADAPPRDSDRHGTHVAGTLVGAAGAGPAIGMAPAARLAVALVLDGGVGGTDAQVLAGIDWALAQGVQVLNLSLGGLTFGPEVPSTYTRALLTAHQHGVPVVAAIGNEGPGTSGSPGNDLFAFGVGAVDARDVIAGFSAGRTQLLTASDLVDEDLLPLPYRKPDLSAPGIAVRSCVPGGGYAAFSGTSMATPHVAGAVALLLAAGGAAVVPAGERGFRLQDVLVGAAVELGESGLDRRFGFGRLDVAAAVAAAVQL